MESPLARKGKEGEERRGEGRGKGEKGTGEKRWNREGRGGEAKGINQRQRKNENSIKGQQFCPVSLIIFLTYLT